MADRLTTVSSEMPPPNAPAKPASKSKGSTPQKTQVAFQIPKQKLKTAPARLVTIQDLAVMITKMCKVSEQKRQMFTEYKSSFNKRMVDIDSIIQQVVDIRADTANDIGQELVVGNTQLVTDAPKGVKDIARLQSELAELDVQKDEHAVKVLEWVKFHCVGTTKESQLQAAMKYVRLDAEDGNDNDMEMIVQGHGGNDGNTN